MRAIVEVLQPWVSPYKISVSRGVSRGTTGGAAWVGKVCDVGASTGSWRTSSTMAARGGADSGALLLQEPQRRVTERSQQRIRCTEQAGCTRVVSSGGRDDAEGIQQRGDLPGQLQRYRDVERGEQVLPGLSESAQVVLQEAKVAKRVGGDKTVADVARHGQALFQPAAGV